MGSPDHRQPTGQRQESAPPGRTIGVRRPQRERTGTVPLGTEGRDAAARATYRIDLGDPGDGLGVRASVDDLEHEVAGLRQALATRNIIGQAQGILIERHGTDSDGAFEMLVRMSQQSHLKLHDVARRLVDTTVAERRAGK